MPRPVFWSLLVASLACGDSGTEPESSVATSIELSPTTVSFETVGATQPLTVTVKDQSGRVMLNQTIAWASSAEAVAKVSATGLVTAIGAGSATITALRISQATIRQSGQLSAVAAVTVTIPTPIYSADGGGRAVRP